MLEVRGVILRLGIGGTVSANKANVRGPELGIWGGTGTVGSGGGTVIVESGGGTTIDGRGTGGSD